MFDIQLLDRVMVVWQVGQPWSRKAVIGQDPLRGT